MIDNSAMFKIGYGLYVISYNDGKRDNAFICNTVIQVTQTPLKLSVTVYHGIITFSSLDKEI